MANSKATTANLANEIAAITTVAQLHKWADAAINA